MYDMYPIYEDSHRGTELWVYMTCNKKEVKSVQRRNINTRYLMLYDIFVSMWHITDLPKKHYILILH